MTLRRQTTVEITHDWAEYNLAHGYRKWQVLATTLTAPIRLILAQTGPRIQVMLKLPGIHCGNKHLEMSTEKPDWLEQQWTPMTTILRWTAEPLFRQMDLAHLEEGRYPAPLPIMRL